MISYRLGHLYLIRNYITRAGAYFEPREILPYQGHTILFGEVRPYQIRIYRGPLEFDGKPVAFPQLSLERSGRHGLAVMAMLIKETGGDDGSGRPFGQWRVSELYPESDAQVLAIKGVLDSEEEPLFSTGKQCAEMWNGTPYKTGWTGRTVNRDGLVKAAQRLVDLFEQTLKLGRLPFWFIDQRRAYLNKLTVGNGRSGSEIA